MKSALSVLTLLWIVSATASPIPAQVLAEPRTTPRLGQRLRYGRRACRCRVPTCAEDAGRLRARAVGQAGVVAPDDRGPRGRSRVDRGFQFWLFGYSTGNPIPYSGYLLRRDLDEARRRLDPGKSDPAFDRMVLVGHSMGGLICKMVAVDSGHRLWRAVCDHPVGELKGEGGDLKLIRDCLIFDAHPGVGRVVYIATPHRGSRLDRGSVQAIGTRLVLLPDALRATRRRLVAANPPDSFREPFRKVLPSSIDELEWESPILTALSELAHPPALRVHTIIAVRPESPPEHRTDGVVGYESAHVAGAASETLVAASHLCQDHPEVIGEVRRILLEHLHP